MSRLPPICWNASPSAPGRVRWRRWPGLGPEQWLAQQLTGQSPDPELDERLKAFPALTMTQAEIDRVYVPNGRLRRADAGRGGA